MLTEWTHRDLRRARFLLNMSQEALGFALGVSRNWVSEMERGRADIEVRTAMSCLYLLSISFGRVIQSMDEIEDGMNASSTAAARNIDGR